MRSRSGLVAGLALALAAPAAAGDGAETRVKFRDANYRPATMTTTYSGTVASSRNSCADERKVVVYRDAKEDIRLGSDLARKNDEGQFVWKVKVGGGAPSAGYFYARAPRTGECAGDKSNVYLFA